MIDDEDELETIAARQESEIKIIEKGRICLRNGEKIEMERLCARPMEIDRRHFIYHSQYRVVRGL